MGWTGIHATHYYKNGMVNRKAECDAYFLEGLNAGYFEVVKSAMVGSTYYAAIRTLLKSAVKDEAGEVIYEPVPKNEQKTWAAIFLTSTDSKDYFNFSYKDMDETCGPCQIDCPEAILKVLSDTNSEWANEWRKSCHERNLKRKFLNDAPVGSKILVKRGKENLLLEKAVRPRKSSKVWVNWEKRCYYPINQILNYEFEEAVPDKEAV